LPLETSILKHILKYKVAVTSQHLEHDIINITVHFRTPHTPTEHVFANLVCVFSVSCAYFSPQEKHGRLRAG
jgi:hypothetical protein